MKFAVGMVMYHTVLAYNCVICDWHPKCMASIEWQESMHVNRLKYGNSQPFYSVIAQDGSRRYVAQGKIDSTRKLNFNKLKTIELNDCLLPENLVPSLLTTLLQDNLDLGKYFSHFFHTHFVPNEQKEEEYPEDAAIRIAFHEDRMNPSL